MSVAARFARSQPKSIPSFFPSVQRRPGPRRGVSERGSENMLEDAAVVPVAERRLNAKPLVAGLAIPLALCLVAVAAVAPVVLSAQAQTREAAVPVFAVGAVLVFGLGLSDLVSAREPAFARAVVITGALWTLSALAVSSTPFLYSVGRICEWLADVGLVFLLISYPSGRLAKSIDRRIIGATVLMATLLWLPTVPLVHHFPAPAVWSTCDTECPTNAFALVHSTPALVQDFVIPIREALMVAVFFVVALILADRALGDPAMRRRIYWPVVSVAALRALEFGIYASVRHSAPSSAALDVVMWAYVLTLPAVALACVSARLHRRIAASTALDHVARRLRTSASPREVRRALADALADPSLQTLFSFPRASGRWVDDSGAPSPPPGARSRQHVTEVASGRWRIAIVHDPALSEDGPLVRTAASYALTALENDHLTGELSSSLNELAQSRASVAAADRARRKIERDLHDGAQQRLIALRVKLSLAAERLEDQDPAGADVIRALEGDVDATIDEVRAFAHGVYPALLAETGLSDALRAAARAAGLPTTVRAHELPRYPPEVEMAVYFSCSEALQNAAKHAHGATGVTISVWQEHELQFEVCDDGSGFDIQATREGIGLTNLHDRLATVGGSIRIESAPGEGTCVSGSIPLRPQVDRNGSSDWRETSALL
jgi:signal transduction histidine kinase